MQRRFAAILAADVVGYSRLMGADEMGTITSLKSHRRELIDPASPSTTAASSRPPVTACWWNSPAWSMRWLRGQYSAQHGPAQRRHAGGQANRIPDRHQCRRHHHRRRRYFRRRRQYRRAAGNAVRARRGLHFEGGERPDQGQAFDGLRRSRRAGGEEHRARGGRVRADRQRHRGHSGSGRRLVCAKTSRRQPPATNRKSISARPETACSWPMRGLAGPPAGQDRPLDDPYRVRF